MDCWIDSVHGHSGVRDGDAVPVCDYCADPVCLLENCAPAVWRTEGAVGRRGDGGGHVHATCCGDCAVPDGSAFACTKRGNSADLAGGIVDSCGQAVGSVSAACAGVSDSSDHRRSGNLVLLLPEPVLL